jgi:TIR domain
VITSGKFDFDVFLSYSAKDQAKVKKIARRLQGDGFRVWFDLWLIRLGDSIPAKIEEGLEGSAVLVFCVSANSLGSDWPKLEVQTFRFRDPINRERRFIPLRFDDAEPKGSLGQFYCLNWRRGGSREAYARLVSACKLGQKSTPAVGDDATNSLTPGPHVLPQEAKNTEGRTVSVGGATRKSWDDPQLAFPPQRPCCQHELRLFTDSRPPAMWWRRRGKPNRMSITASMRPELSSIHP